MACGEILKGINPSWRQFNEEILWGSKNNSLITDLKSVDCLSEELKNEDEKIILVCLGPLTNIAGLIKKDASLLSKIERIIWYNGSVQPLQGFNYECDKNSADLVFKSNVRIDVISNLEKENSLFDLSMLEVCKQSKTQLAISLYYVHNQPVVLDKLKQNHFKLSDDLIAIYLTNPELFGINIITNKLKVRYNQDYNVQGS